jgi:hypothetical protein
MAIYFGGKDKMCLGLYVECMNILPNFNHFVGALEEQRKATVSFVMSARPLGTARLPLNGFS